MSYYEGEEVSYIGSCSFPYGDYYVESDFDSDILHSIGSGSNVQYYCSMSFNRGDIIYVIANVDFPQGGYFKFRIGCTFSSDFYDNERGAKDDFWEQIYCETADYAIYGGQSVYCDYLGDDFTLSQLTDEAPSLPPVEAFTTGDVTETAGYPGSFNLAVADGIVNSTKEFLPNLFVSVIPIALTAFGVGFGIKKALLYFREIGSGGSRS